LSGTATPLPKIGLLSRDQIIEHHNQTLVNLAVEGVVLRVPPSAAITFGSPATPAENPVGVSRADGTFDMSLSDNRRKLEAVEQLAKVTDEAGAALIELAIAFVVNHPAVTSAIIGPHTMEQPRRPAARRPTAAK